MSLPTTRTEFKEHCLRRLGDGVIEINASDVQLEDRIDEALSYYQDYHFDGTQKLFLSHQLTADDITNKYLPITEDVIGIVRILDVGTTSSTNNLFNLRYQLALSDMYAFSNTRFAPYYMALQNVALAEELFSGKQGIRYNRHVNKLHIDVDWEAMVEGEYVIIEAYAIVDPDTYANVWKDRWLIQYATALMKRQWGENLKKFEGMTMPGGVQFNGQKIWDEAVEEIRKLEEEMITSYSLPVSDMIG
jgi:hypothetical protein